MVLKITVKTLDSQNHNFEADLDWTVKDFKEHIQSAVDVPVDQQRLIFCGRILQDDKKLNDYDCNEKVLHLVKRPPPSLNPSDQSPQLTTDNTGNEPGRTRLHEVIRIIGDSPGLGVSTDLNSQLHQVLQQVASSLQRVFPTDGANSNGVSTSIGVTITPHFVGPLTSPPIQRANATNTISATSNQSAIRAEQAQSIANHLIRVRSLTPQQITRIMSAHPDWVPIIEADIKSMEQHRRNNVQQHYFSNAYLSSIPRKRRRLLTKNTDDVLILHPSPSHAITNLVRRAITNSDVAPIEGSLDQILVDVSSDPELQNAYDEFIRGAVESRLRCDSDYCPTKFENSRRYFM